MHWAKLEDQYMKDLPPQLTRLVIESNQTITDEGVSLIVKTCPNLQVLNVEKTSFTDKCLPEIANLKNLKELSLKQHMTKMTSAPTLQLIASLPNLQKISL